MFSPLGTLSVWGKVLAVVAAGVMVSSFAMIFMDASNIAVDSHQVAVVSRDTVNARQSPSTNSTIIIKARSGERFQITDTGDNWTAVRTYDRKISGWIVSVLLGRKTARTLNFQYEMRGYFSVGLISMLVIFFALCIKEVSVHVPFSGKRGSETLLVDNE